MTLEEFQSILKKHKLDAYIVTRGNMFIGQDLLVEENRIQDLTGFTGSAGTLIVTPNKAFLCVDGRYDIQAAQQTNPAEVEILTGSRQNVYKWLNTLNNNKTYKVAYNSWTNGIKEVANWKRSFANITFIPDPSEIFDNNLNLKKTRVFEHKSEFAGVESIEKIAEITRYNQQQKLDAFLFTAADSVSWLLNLRSDALPDTPIFRAFALVDISGRVTVFADNIKLDFTPSPDIDFQPFKNLEKILKTYKKKSIGIDFDGAPQIIASLCEKHKVNYRNRFNPTLLSKAIKNPVEISGIEASHLRDGTTLCKFLYWLENNLSGLTELDVVTKLHEFRSQGENFWSESFGTIAGFGENGAIVHYQPTPETNRTLVPGSLLLLDSGAQYFDGTTDVTRTLPVGNPSSEMIDNFTLVLKAHIALASACFPQRANGVSLDKIARSVMWQQGKDYNHGTGHGVGCFLNVHEGPQNMGNLSSQHTIMENMILSIEPGYYKEGAYGIRIENLARVTAVENPDFSEPFHQFKILTLCPIDKRLVNKYLMSSGEISWLNNYHQEVFEKISPFLNKDETNWLKDACSPL